MPTSLDFYQELYSRYVQLNQTSLIVNATLEFYDDSFRREIEGQAALLIVPYKCYFPNCDSVESVWNDIILLLWNLGGHLKVKNFPPNPNPSVETQDMTTIDYGSTPENPWGNKAWGTWGQHKVDTMRLYGVGREMDFYRYHFIREGQFKDGALNGYGREIIGEGSSMYTGEF